MNVWQRCRFKTNKTDDPRPVKFPPPGPFWVSGQSDTHAIVVAYFISEDQLRRYWPEAEEEEWTNKVPLQFNDRFPRPDWFTQRLENEAINPPGLSIALSPEARRRIVESAVSRDIADEDLQYQDMGVKLLHLINRTEHNKFDDDFVSGYYHKTRKKNIKHSQVLLVKILMESKTITEDQAISILRPIYE